MPCNSDHCGPDGREIESARIIKFLDQIGILEGDIPMNGFQPSVYGDVSKLDKHTAQLCDFCSKNDITKYSLELQIWWRDHQEVDKQRVEKELAAKKTEEERKEVLNKLTEHERKILGLSHLDLEIIDISDYEGLTNFVEKGKYKN